MKDRSSAGCLILVEGVMETYTLLVKRNQYGNYPLTWCGPGGRIDEGETPHEAAIRETKEEVNVNLSPYRYTHKFVQPLVNETGKYTTFVYKISDMEASKFNIDIDHESLDWGWFNKNQIREMDIHPGMPYVLKQLDMWG